VLKSQHRTLWSTVLPCQSSEYKLAKSFSIRNQRKLFWDPKSRVPKGRFGLLKFATNLRLEECATELTRGESDVFTSNRAEFQREDLVYWSLLQIFVERNVIRRGESDYLHRIERCHRRKQSTSLSENPPRQYFWGTTKSFGNAHKILNAIWIVFAMRTGINFRIACLGF